VRHWFSARRSRSSLPSEIVRAVQDWMIAAEVGELSLEEVGDYYTVRFNADASPVPGVYLPRDTLSEEDALISLLQTALDVYYDEMNFDR